MLHTLVSEARNGMTAAAVALACERDPHEQEDIDEIETALQILLEDGLAEQEFDSRREPDDGNDNTTLETQAMPELGATPEIETRPETRTTQLHTSSETHTTAHTPPQPLYRPTRAAIRARELSF